MFRRPLTAVTLSARPYVCLLCSSGARAAPALRPARFYSDSSLASQPEPGPEPGPEPVNEPVHNLPVRDGKPTGPEERSADTVAELVALTAEKGKWLRDSEAFDKLQHRREMAQKNRLKQRAKAKARKEAKEAQQSSEEGKEVKAAKGTKVAKKTKDKTGNDDASSLRGEKGATKKSRKESKTKSEKDAAKKSKKSAKKSAKTPASPGLIRRVKSEAAAQPDADPESSIELARKLLSENPALIRKIWTKAKEQPAEGTEFSIGLTRKVGQKDAAWEVIRKVALEAKPEEPWVVSPFFAAEKKWPLWPRSTLDRAQGEASPSPLEAFPTLDNVQEEADPSPAEDSHKQDTFQFTRERPSVRSARLATAVPLKDLPVPFERSNETLETDSIPPADLELTPLSEPVSVPSLAYGLDRVLFNPGVYHLQDPRTRVYNFDPYLRSIMPVSEFDFDALNEYITSSRDETLRQFARDHGKKYIGSSSSMTSVLSHFHFLLSEWRAPNMSRISQSFGKTMKSFTRVTRAPTAVFLKYRDGVYAIDADKEFDSANLLMSLGKSMEKLLTLPTDQFERFRKSSDNKVTRDEVEDESYHYTTLGDFLMRAQLDAYDKRLPGTGMFDLKTRAVVSIRMDSTRHESGMGYQIKTLHGEFESFEREYHDMIRGAFLKYSLQVRIGRMDGIFVAYHNIQRIFGFQYISLPEMDHALHGQEDPALGDVEFKLSVALWNKVLDRAAARFPGQSLRMHFETRENMVPYMTIFATPVTDEEIDAIQSKNSAKIEAFNKRILFPELYAEEESSSETSEAGDESLSSDDKESSAAEAGLNVVDGELSSTGDVASDAETLPSQSSRTSLDASSHEHGELSSTGDVASDAETSPSESSGPPLDVSSNDHGELSSTGDVASDAETSPSESTGPALDASAHEHSASSGDPDRAVPEKSAEDTDDKSAEVEQERPVLAMALSIENFINDKRVRRPDRLKAGTKWTVKYRLSEFPENRGRELYNICKNRRRKIYEEVTDEKSKDFGFIGILKKISKKGQQWRDAEDLIEEEQGIVTVDDPAQR